MKSTHDATNQNCSCTSCTYKSESEHPSLRRIIAEGSRIDKLYFGKYIPLRERKLLDKLVRTRAVYDDIRNQLLSESEASMREKPNLKPRKHHSRAKELKGRRSSAIIELIDMVDKGKVSGPATPSECCKCCICGSKTIHTHQEHLEMHRQRYGQGKYGGRMADAMSKTSVMIKRKMAEAKRGVVRHGRGYARRMSRTSTMMRQLREAKGTAGQTQTLSRTSMMMKKKVGEAARNVRLKAKSIMSEPCTCTSRLSEEVRHRSGEVARRFRPKVQLGEQTMFEGLLSKKYSKSKMPAEEPRELSVMKKHHKKGKALRESYQKIKKSKARLMESVGEGARRVKESKTKIQKHIKAEAQKSLEKIRETKQKLNENIKTAVKKSIQDLDFPIRKDSILKYKEKIKTNRHLRDYECQHECIPGECDPRECFKILQLRRRRSQKKEKDEVAIRKNISMRSSVSDTGVQVRQQGVVKKTETDQDRRKNIVAKTEQKKVVTKVGPDKKKNTESMKKGTTIEPRINIDIKKKSAEAKLKTDKIKGKAPKETRSLKSITSLLPTASKQVARVPSGQETKKPEQKQQAELATSVLLKTRKRQRVEYRPVQGNIEKMQTGPKKGRQLPRESSLFSFSLEFSKGKDQQEPVARQIYIERREWTRGTGTGTGSGTGKEVRQLSQTKLEQIKQDTGKAVSQISQTKLKQIEQDTGKAVPRISPTKFRQKKRDTQTGGHALRRCFCTLKLKGKGQRPIPRPSISITNETQSQTNKLDENITGDRVQTKPVKSREMACVTCESSKCDPRECIKFQKNRHLGVDFKRESKSASSLASTSISTSSKSVTARAPQIKQRAKKPVSEQQSTKSVNVEPKDQKQVVRISSSFSFNIEFHKDKQPENIEAQSYTSANKIVKNQNKGTPKRKHLRHKYSQITGMTGRSKYTLTKHSLRRCFCTLKLGQPNKKKHLSKAAGSATSQQAIQYTPDISRDLVSINKGVATDKKRRNHLLPCEPGICVPGECDPYACLELINKRNIKYSNKYSNTDLKRRLKVRPSNTDYRKTKSTSSFTSRSMPNKIKKIQSTVGTSERRKGKALRPIQTTHSSPNRQVVRISSSFSFNIEFYKGDNTSPLAADMDTPLTHSSQQLDTAKKPRTKDGGYQYDKAKKHQRSTSVLVKKRNRGSFIGPMKRCFCTLQLQTKGLKEETNISIGTLTPVENAVEYKNVMMTKGTKTKRPKNKYGYALEPYECEPGICIPGECNPYECLKLIQTRQLKETGTATDKVKMKSATSVTRKQRLRSKGALVQSKLKGRKVSTVTRQSKPLPTTYSTEVQKPHRQAVRIGSSFSFDIEFRKDKLHSTFVKEESLNKITNYKPVKRIRNRGSKSTATSSNQDTQASITRANKAAGIKPMLKRCFCTLKLQSNQNKRIKTNIKVPNVIAVSRVTVTETKIKSRKNVLINELSSTKICSDSPNKCRDKSRDENWAATLYNFHTSTGTISKSSILFQYKEMQSYFHKNDMESVRTYALTNDIRPRKIFTRSYSVLPTFYSKINEKLSYSDNCIMRCKNNNKRYLKKRNSLLKYQKLRLYSKKSSIFSDPQHAPDSQLKSQNYFAMNIQIPERKYKLKPYECEPGVCVPDECDPYECQKLIMKRLMKKVSKMSGTNVKARSMSSSTALSTSSSKRLQSKQPHGKTKKVPARGVTFKTIPNRNHKRAVRVGSSFSFNIEFSKDRSAPPIDMAPRPTVTSHKPTKPPKKRIKEQGTKGQGGNYRDNDSQSGTETVNKGSGMKPMMQRCFCTLKLQKKGKHQRNKKIKAPQRAHGRGTATPPNTMNEFISSRTVINQGQNTTHRKLLPYECEPLVCVPGECDPYECLERIKKRNKTHRDSGTGVMRYNTSTGSMTGKNQYRTQGKQIQSKHKNKQTRSRGSTESRSSRVERYQERPSKQAVRIGSSFSFNVEFFKENSQTQSAVVQKEPQRVVKPSVESVRVPKQKIHKTKFRERGSQDSKFLRDGDSQIGFPTQGKSTMTTAFMKRCFCTAKLHGKQKQVAAEIKPLQTKGSQAIYKEPFLRRCFCVMQKLKRSKQPKPPITYSHAGTETIKETAIKTKKVNRRKKSPGLELEPYECEPGICVPGECNPYECEKMIKARNMKLQTRGAFTDKPKTKSSSSNYSSQTSKARRTQSNFKTATSTTKARPSSTVKEVQPVRHLSSDRQVVRIGSNFSFSVEFYKDRSPNTEEVQAAAKAIRKIPPPKPKTKAIKTLKTDHGTHDRGSMGSNNTYNQESQADKARMKDQGSGIGPVLKRCFCTLKLQNNKNKNIKLSASQATETMPEIPTLQTRGVGTGKYWKLKPYECEPGVCIPYQCDPNECDKLIKKRLLKETGVMTSGKEKPLGYKLLPYECEPGFCIPGQCNPYECEKRIQLRNMKHRNSGTSPKRYRGKSVSSDFHSTTSSKARRIQHKKRERQKRSQSVFSKPPRVRRSLDSAVRQSVRIGSGFSFDVEFYKNKSNTIHDDTNILPLKQNIKHTKSMSSSANQRSPGTKSRNVQYRKDVRDTDSQIFAKKMRNSGVNPFLKRCFCTLKLQKSGDVASKQRIFSRAARDQSVYLATLLPYECEPGICIPGECDPYECQKRIQKRLMRSQRTGTERTSQDSSTSSTAGAKYKASTCQSPTCPQKQKHQKGTYAKAGRYYESARPTYSSSSSSRQAIHIGSSFKFDMEFYKDRSPKDETIKRQSYVDHKKRMHSITTQPRYKTKRSRSVTSSDIRFRNNQMQAGSRTESKSTGFGPRLKRCFCTLALHKKRSPPETRTKSTFRNDDLSDLYTFSKNVGVGTRKKYAHLKPYECEPGVCVPGSCDPYECYERIKRRMRDSGTATMSPSKKYASSITSENAKYRSAKTQYLKDKKRRERPTMAHIKECTPRCAGVSKIAGNNNRQAVRIGSNFSFSMEFYKDRPSAKIPKAVYKIKDLDSRPNKPKFRRASMVTSTQKNYKSRPSYAGKSGTNQICQSDCVKNVSQGTTMGAFLKRCFCTLNLYKNNTPGKSKSKMLKAEKPNKIKAENPSPGKTKSKMLKAEKPKKNKAEKPSPGKTKSKMLKPEKPKQIKAEEPKKKEKPLEVNKAAMVQTHEKYTGKNKRYSLKPYECEPNVCIPGECNPYECDERIRRRNIRRQSRRIGTHRRSSQVSVGSMASRLVPRSSRRIQSGERRARNVARPSQISTFVEEPRFAHTLEEMRTGVKIGSNVSFNIEFYKDKSQVPTYENIKRYDDYQPKAVKVKYRDGHRKSTFSESRPKAMHRGIGNKCDRRTCEAQASGVTMVDKAAGVNNKLKRCFCTLKLHKNAPKGITVNRLAIENIVPEILRSKKKIKKNENVKFLEHLTNEDRAKNYLNKQYNINHKYSKKAHGDYKEMTTIYPYMPNKYNKYASNTFLFPDIKSSQLNLGRIGRILGNQTTKKLKIPNKPNTYCQSGKFIEKTELPNKGNVTKNKANNEDVRMNNVKLFVRRMFTRLFSRNKKMSPLTEIKPETDKHNVNVNSEFLNKGRIIKTKQDALKASKSDRQPVHVKQQSVPKKTISQNITPAPEKKRRNRENVSIYMTKKQNSRYQSGDIGQPKLKVTRNRVQNFSIHEGNPLCCSYCQVLKDAKKMYTRPPYESTKIVQMALIKNKIKSESTTTNAKNKNKVQNQCVCFANNHSSGEDPKKKLIQCMCFINNTKSAKSHKSDIQSYSTQSIENKSSCCPCHSHGKKGQLSSGDAPIQNVKGNRLQAKFQKKNKTDDVGKKYQNLEVGEGKAKKIKHVDDKKAKLPVNKKGEIVEARTDKKFGKFKTAKKAGLNETKKKVLVSDIKGKNKKVGVNQEAITGKKFGKPMKNKKAELDVKNKVQAETTKGSNIAKLKKPKKVEFDELSKSKIKASNKNKKAAGDAPSKSGESDKSKNKEQSPKTKQPKSKANAKAKGKGMVYGAKITIKAKGGLLSNQSPSKPVSKVKGKPDSKIKIKPDSKIQKIKQCVCGSTICQKETKKMAASKMQKGDVKKTTPCICGSVPCAKEIKELKKRKKEESRMKAKKEKASCLCAEEIIRQKALAKKKLEDERKRKIYLKKLKKKFRAEDEIRRKERIKQERFKNWELKKFKQSGDGTLAAESLLDVLKLGMTASRDVLRCSTRAILHPQHTALSMKELANDPTRALSAFGSAVSDSGVVSTIGRIRTRCASMKRVQSVITKLEGNRVTRYLMYMCSKDPKKRIGPKAKRMVRKREPIDFECSLFMASLRKRPCLAVYYTCPWFYPHCLSMLNLWKQFTDVMLFLVAVAVWSPFIVLMEICRAAVCCFFCTG